MASGIKDAFLQVDANSDGYVSKEELSAMFYELDSETWTQERLDAIFQLVDIDEDGRLKYGEFIDWAFKEELITPEARSAVETMQRDDSVEFVMMNNTEDVAYEFTITFRDCLNCSYPQGNPFVLEVGPGIKQSADLVQKADAGPWKWKYRWASKTVYFEREENPDAFVDEEFPADMSSIGKSSSCFSCADSVDRWVRAAALGAPDKAKLFDNISPNDIVQGKLGDCWLLSAIASMAEYPEALKSMFEESEVSEMGAYGIRLFDPEAGRMSVTIDDRIPCNIRNGRPVPIFAKNDGEELWAVLLEKAFAKYCGSYGALSGGNAAWAFFVMTGEMQIRQFRKRTSDDVWLRFKFNKKQLISQGARNPRNCRWNLCDPDFMQSEFPGDDLFAELRYHSNAHHIMSCMIRGENAERVKEVGLVTRHIYSVLVVRDVTLADGSPERLVKIRNPWGDTEWKGAWSDSSETWESNPDLVEELGLTSEADGTFWMSWNDFISSFDYVQTCPWDGKTPEGYEEAEFSGSEPEEDDAADDTGVPDEEAD